MYITTDYCTIYYEYCNYNIFNIISFIIHILIQSTQQICCKFYVGYDIINIGPITLYILR